MWTILASTPLPDAPYWPGRRMLSLFDAVVWPAALAALVLQLPEPVGIVGPVLLSLLLLSAISRMCRATWRNHRYQFTTRRWFRVGAAVLLIGLAAKVAAAPFHW